MVQFCYVTGTRLLVNRGVWASLGHSQKSRDQIAREQRGLGFFGSLTEMHEVYGVDTGAKKLP